MGSTSAPLAGSTGARTAIRDEGLLLGEDDEDTQADKYLSFRIGEESYCVGIRFVTEIIELQRISALPDMPPSVKGVINLRGSVIPVMDLRLRFGMAERRYDDRTCVVVADLRSMSIGFIVDTVEEVTEMAADDIGPAPRLRSGSGEAKYISGIGKAGGKVKILIDLERIVGEDAEEALAKRVGGSHA
jgi:purine-binding chemotaxis protein CheW